MWHWLKKIKPKRSQSACVEATACVTVDASAATVTLAGQWLLAARRPHFTSLRQQLDQSTIAEIVVETNQLEAWDSTAISYLLQLHRFCVASQKTLSMTQLPAGAKRLLALATKVDPITPHRAAQGPRGLWDSCLRPLHDWHRGLSAFTHFIGLVAIALVQWLRGRANTRLSDIGYFIDQVGPKAIGIIALTSILVGMILAYLGSVQLQQFGAQIYVANLVALGITREMGALMTAVVMAGRTGAAYAAQLGTMQANEEIDSMITLGLSPVEFLVLPRMIALVLIMPLLTVYSMLLGMLGGSFVAISMGITTSQYIAQLQSSISMADVMAGLYKSFVFAVLIAIAGCQAGLQCGRTSAAVGTATTQAVVTAIVYLIVADAAMNILYQVLGI